MLRASRREGLARRAAKPRRAAPLTMSSGFCEGSVRMTAFTPGFAVTTFLQEDVRGGEASFDAGQPHAALEAIRGVLLSSSTFNELAMRTGRKRDFANRVTQTGCRNSVDGCVTTVTRESCRRTPCSTPHTLPRRPSRPTHSVTADAAERTHHQPVQRLHSILKFRRGTKTVVND